MKNTGNIIYISILALLIMSIGGNVLEAQSEFYASQGPLNNFDFEHGTQGWEIPEWTIGRKDYVGRYILQSSERSLKNDLSLKLMCKFPRGSWAAALVEYHPESMITAGSHVSVDVFIPKKARGSEFKARIIVTLDKSGKVLEGDAFALDRGEWSRVSLGLDLDTRRREKISKIAVRVEREATAWDKKRLYKGPIYIDNMLVK